MYKKILSCIKEIIKMSRSKKNLISDIVGVTKNHRYLKVIKDNTTGEFKQPSNVSLSGIKQIWNPENPKFYNPEFMYLPGLRIAGLKSDIKEYLLKNSVSEESIEDEFNNAYTSDRQQSSNIQRISKCVEVQDGDDPNKTRVEFIKDRVATFSENLQNELISLKKFEVDKKGQKVPSIKISLNQMADLLNNLPGKAPKIKEQKAPKQKKEPKPKAEKEVKSPKVQKTPSSPKTSKVQKTPSSPKTSKVQKNVSSPKTSKVQKNVSSPKTSKVQKDVSSPKTSKVQKNVSSPKTTVTSPRSASSVIDTLKAIYNSNKDNTESSFYNITGLKSDYKGARKVKTLASNGILMGDTDDKNGLGYAFFTLKDNDTVPPGVYVLLNALGQESPERYVRSIIKNSSDKKEKVDQPKTDNQPVRALSPLPLRAVSPGKLFATPSLSNITPTFASMPVFKAASPIKPLPSLPTNGGFPFAGGLKLPTPSFPTMPSK